MTNAVLICDDSVLAQKQLRRCLPSSRQAFVEFAKDGKDALMRMRQNKYKVVFLDLTMPVMDGIEVLKTNQAEGLADTVIVVSADIQPKMQAKVLELGALAFIKKPVQKNELASILKEHGIHD